MVNLTAEWDKPGRAQEVDAYWRNSPDEREYRARLAALVHEVMGKDSDPLLEVGCGSGLIFEALTQEIGHPPKYVGVDASAKMLAIARRRYKVPPDLFHAGKAELLDHIPDWKFDIAFAFEVFGHMPDCTRAMAELLRVASHAAIFTLWVKDGPMAPLAGQDHYEYPAGWAEEAVASIMGKAHYQIERRTMPWTQAYIVRRGRR